MILYFILNWRRKEAPIGMDIAWNCRMLSPEVASIGGGIDLIMVGEILFGVRVGDRHQY